MKRFFNAAEFRTSWVYLALVCSIALALTMSPWAFAEESIPEPPTNAAVVSDVQEQPAGESAPEQPLHEDPAVPEPPAQPEPPTNPESPAVPEVPAEPAPEPPVNPEPVVPAPDAPTVPEPVEPAPTETEAPVIPEPKPTETLEPTVTPTPSPTPAPTPSPTTELSPTPEPTPVITWSQTQPVRCDLRDGQPAGLKYDESRTYHCEVSAQVSSDIAMPDDMEIEWNLTVDFPDNYALEFPQGSLAIVKDQVPAGTSTKYTITRPWSDSAEQKLNFEVVVTRNTCAVGEQVLSVQASPDIDTRASDANITRQGPQPQPARSTTEFLPNLEAPTVSMTAVNFGTLEWDGYSWGTADGFSTVTVSNVQPCATSQDHVVTLRINAEHPGLNPALVAVNGVDASESWLSESDYLVATIPAGFEGSSTFEVQLMLRPTNEVMVGNYSIGFEVSIKEAS